MVSAGTHALKIHAATNLFLAAVFLRSRIFDRVSLSGSPVPIACVELLQLSENRLCVVNLHLDISDGIDHRTIRFPKPWLV